MFIVSILLTIVAILVALLAICGLIYSISEGCGESFFVVILLGFMSFMLFMVSTELRDKALGRNSPISEQKSTEEKSTIQTRIEKLKKELADAEQSLKDCKHDWNEPEFDPEKIRSDVASHQLTQDVYGWSSKVVLDDERARWSRTCKHCGVKEYTYKQGAKVVKTGPQFE